MTQTPSTHDLMVNGLRLRSEQRGHGPVVLLLHGFPDSFHLWREVAPRLADAGFRTLAVDQRGCGDSDAPAGARHYGIDQLVRDAAGMLRAVRAQTPCTSSATTGARWLPGASP